jgi:hypothetical protein
MILSMPVTPPAPYGLIGSWQQEDGQLLRAMRAQDEHALNITRTAWPADKGHETWKFGLVLVLHPPQGSTQVRHHLIPARQHYVMRRQY